MNGVRVVARYNDPVSAPVKAGDKVGEIIAQKNGAMEYNLDSNGKETVLVITFSSANLFKK